MQGMGGALKWPSAYEVYLSAWLAVVATSVGWRAVKGDTTGLAHLLRDALVAGVIAGIVELLRRVPRRRFRKERK